MKQFAQNLKLSGPANLGDIMQSKSNNHFPLNQKKIGISASENGANDTDSEQITFDQQKIILHHLIRHFLGAGAQIIYGGDNRKDGLTKYFVKWAKQSFVKGKDLPEPFINYSEADSILTAPTHSVFSQNQISDIFTSREKQRMTKHNLLSYMREKMVSECDARIFIGGKSANYKGLFPGVLQEALISIRQKKPAYFIGAFGGVTAEIIKALKGENIESLTYDLMESFFYGRTDDSRYDLTRQRYSAISEGLTELTELGIEGLSELNHLSISDNERLFSCKDSQEIFQLCMKGIVKKEV